jgi:hypothetical protein
MSAKTETLAVPARHVASDVLAIGSLAYVVPAT